MSPRAVARWEGFTHRQLARRWDRPESRIHLFGCIGSTNEEARRLAEGGAPAGTVVLCREQTQGRGQAGRSWVSPPGTGVYLSLVLRPTGLPDPGLVPLLAGLGVATELHTAFPQLSPALRWPNDIIVRDRKCAGILAEASWGEAPRYLVVGVGVNVRPLPERTPAQVRRSAISLEEAVGRSVKLVEAADAVVRGVEEELEEVPERLVPSQLERLDRIDWLRDRRARIHPPASDEGVVGRCVGIAPDGALLFRPDRGALRRVKAARVEVVE